MMHSNFLCVSAVLCAILISYNRVDAMTMEQMENAARGVRNTCVTKSGADPAMVAGVKNGEFPEDEKFQCYFKCVMGFLKAMKNGKVQVDPIIKAFKLMMPPEMQEGNVAASEYCGTLEQGDNPCTNAWQFVKCQYTRAADVFFFP